MLSRAFCQIVKLHNCPIIIFHQKVFSLVDIILNNRPLFSYRNNGSSLIVKHNDAVLKVYPKTVSSCLM